MVPERTRIREPSMGGQGYQLPGEASEAANAERAQDKTIRADTIRNQAKFIQRGIGASRSGFSGPVTMAGSADGWM
jgi:hypothetical protein